MSKDRLQRKVEAMTRPTQTRIHGELDSSGRRLQLKKRAQAVEEQWRMAHGIDDKLRNKPQQKATRNRQQRLERGEIRRREERKQQRIDRSLLRLPSLKSGGGDDGPRLIKQAQHETGPVHYSNGWNICKCPESREEPGPGHLAVFVQIREIRR
jgi:hypothetical protein